jgi:hypothetical protein
MNTSGARWSGLLVCILSAPLVGGCGVTWMATTALWYDTPFPYDRTRVKVIDAETGEPVAGATVGVDYSGTGWVTPHGDSAMTAADGTAEVRVAGTEGRWSAEGPDHLRNVDDRARLDSVVRVYRKPAPTVRLVLPNGFRGAFGFPRFIRCDPVDKVADHAPGKRVFDCEVATDVLVRFDDPLELSDTFDKFRRTKVPPLPKLVAPDEGKDKLREACYADGVRLDVLYERRRDDGVAVRRVGGLTSSGRDVWVVGTDAEAAQWAERLEREQRAQATARPERAGSFYAEYGYESPGDPAADK